MPQIENVLTTIGCFILSGFIGYYLSKSLTKSRNINPTIRNTPEPEYNYGHVIMLSSCNGCDEMRDLNSCDHFLCASCCYNSKHDICKKHEWGADRPDRHDNDISCYFCKIRASDNSCVTCPSHCTKYYCPIHNYESEYEDLTDDEAIREVRDTINPILTNKLPDDIIDKIFSEFLDCRPKCGKCNALIKTNYFKDKPCWECKKVFCELCIGRKKLIDLGMTGAYIYWCVDCCDKPKALADQQS